jgi:hypothetical protein
MIKRTTILLTAAFAFATFTGTALAADRDRDQLKDKDRIHDRLKDGSCKGFSSETPAGLILAADQLRTRDRDRSRDRDRTRDRISKPTA